MKDIRRWLNSLLYNSDLQTIEDRLFSSAVVVSVFITLIACILALVLRQTVFLSLVGYTILAALITIYYFIRVKKIIKPFIPVYVFFCLFANTALWFLSGAINGQNILILSITFILSIIIVPQPRRILILFLYLGLVIALYLVYALKPDWVFQYHSETSRMIDGITTTLYSLFFIYLIVHFLLRNYAFEKAKAERSEMTLQNLNRDLEVRITERTKELSHSMERFHTLLNSTAEGIYGMDKEGNFTFVNTSALKILGYISERELLGRNCHALIHHTHPDGSRYEEKNCILYKAIRQEVGTHADDEYLWRSDGKMFPAEIWSYPILIDGKVQGAVVTFLDITDRKKAEKELRKAKLEAEIANNAKSEFLTNVSHEFRTPLNLVLGYADLLETAEENRRKEYADSIRTSGMRLLDMVDDILELIRAEKAEVELDNNRLDTVAFFSGFETSYESNIAGKALKFKVELAEDLPSSIYIDGTRLRLVINNLVDNAIKFTEKGEVILKIYHKRSESSGRHNRISLIIEVKDTGIGISEEHQKRLFKAFEQAEKKTTSSGLGIGLSITHNVVTRMNGFIKVISQSGLGSRFIVTIRDIEYSNEPRQTPRVEKGKEEKPPLSKIDKSEIIDLNGLIEALEGKHTITCKSFETRQPIGEVIKFGKELSELGIKHNSRLIEEYGKDLTDSAHSFHIDNMLILIRKFSENIKLLRN